MNINQLAAQRIKELRAKKGLTAEAVANQLEISKAAYSQLENGHTELTLTRIEAISSILKVPIPEIIPSGATNNQTINGDHGANVSNNSAHTINNFFSNSDNMETLLNAIKTAFGAKQ